MTVDSIDFGDDSSKIPAHKDMGPSEMLTRTWEESGSINALIDRVENMRGRGVAIGFASDIDENGNGDAYAALVGEGDELIIKMFHLKRNEPEGAGSKEFGVFSPENLKSYSEQGSRGERRAFRELRYGMVSKMLIDSEGLGLLEIEREDIKLLPAWESRIDGILNANESHGSNDHYVLQKAKELSLQITVMCMKCYFEKDVVADLLKKKGIKVKEK